MTYYYKRETDLEFEEAIEVVTARLQDHGFGVLTEIDVKATMKKKLDVDVPEYRILGACNPPFAFEALQHEPYIGTMLPCNVIVRRNEQGRIEVAAVDPVASMQAVPNPKLQTIADDVRQRLRDVIDSL